jgi:hypothetical protein
MAAFFGNSCYLRSDSEDAEKHRRSTDARSSFFLNM